MRASRPLRCFTTGNAQCFGGSVIELRRTVAQLLHLVAHDYAREVNGLQDISRPGVSSPILSVEEDPRAHRLDECDLHRSPVGRTRNLDGLVMRVEYLYITPERRQNRNGLTAGEAFEGAAV